MNAAASQEFREPADILIGARHRKELGDLLALARSINDRGGLIHPIAITSKNELIAGERRLLAWQSPECRFRGRPIPVTVIDIDSIAAGESDENDPQLRKAFTPSEIVAIARTLRPHLEAQARERQRQHGGTAPGRAAEHSGQIATSVFPAGRTRDLIAKATGRGARTLEKATAIVEAAEAEPEKFGKLVEAMDRTGSVNAPFKRLQNIKAAEEIKNKPPGLPAQGPYHSGIIDFPWTSEPNDDERDHGARGYYPYPTMTPKQGAELALGSILAPDCSVWLWITNFHLMHGYHLALADAWGLRPVALLTWVKSRWGQGQRVRGATEHLMQLIRGNVPCLGSDTKSWFEGASGEHSQKPVIAYEIVQKLSPAPRYFELFARGTAPEGWDMHGNEVGKLITPRAPEETKVGQSPASGKLPEARETPVAHDPQLDIPNFNPRLTREAVAS